MLVVEPIGRGHVPLVKPVAVGFDSADQQYSRPPGVKCVERPQRLPPALTSELAHPAMA